MQRLACVCLGLLALTGCDDGGEGDAPAAVIDASVLEQPVTCDEASRRAVLPDPPALITCPVALETITIGNLEMFKYEASHPLASSTVAFPCADDPGDVEFKAPAVPTEPCSVAGVRPWHTVKWDDADAACDAIGWRLCRGVELIRACGGEEGLRYAYGSGFQAGKCNVREAFVAEGAERGSEAPTGAFEECESPSGAFDVNGNLWEWTSDRQENDSRARFYQGAGWRTIAQRHQDEYQTCDTVTPVLSLSAPSYANEYVGFRCCRNVE